MSFPGYDDIEDPLLCYIFFHGGLDHAVHASDTYRPLAEFFELSPVERNKLLEDESGRSIWNNMVQWARRKLKERGYLASSRYGTWRLSDTGILAAQRIQHKYHQLK